MTIDKAFDGVMKRQSLAWMVISMIAISFGYWFARQQLYVLSPSAIDTFPTLYFLLTIIKSTLTILIFYALTQFVLSHLLRSSFRALFVAITFMPLCLVYAGWSLMAVVGLIFAMQLLISVMVLKKNDYLYLYSQYGIDALVLIFFITLHCLITTRFSPVSWGHALLAAAGYNSEEIAPLAPVYKGFILAKQYAFSGIDYAQWAGIMNPPVTLNSPLMQFITLIFDLPSVSTEAFHAVLMAIYLIIMIGGSFGFYLFLRYAASLNILLAIFGGVLFFIGGSPVVADSFLADGGIFLSPYAVFPYALLGVAVAFRRNSPLAAIWAGVALAAQFFVSSPHPEGAIYSVGFFSIFAIGLCLFTDNLIWRDKIKLVTVSLGAWFLLSAYTIIPILYDRLMGNMYVFAHIGDINKINLKPFYPYIAILIVMMPLSWHLLARAKRLTPVYKSSVLLAFALLSFILIAHEVVVVKALVSLFHIGLHFWVVSRMGLYFCMSVYIVTLYAFQAIVDNVGSRKVAWLSSFSTLWLMIGIGIVIFPFAPTTSNLRADNPHACPYYVSLQTILANYPAFATDAANIRLIKSRLAAFEKLPNNNPVINHYKMQYDSRLKPFSYSSIHQVSDAEMILKVARATYDVIDNYHFDNRVSCVNPLYNWSQKHSRRILNYNIGGLYYNQIPDRYARILFSVDSGIHIGAFPGYFVNNQTTILGTQFLTGMPLLTALYVLPYYNYAVLGTYAGLVPWCAFWSGSVTDPAIRHILDIGGMDYFTVSQKDIQKRLDAGDKVSIKGVIRLADVAPKRFGGDFVTYRNLRSYGMAYLANDITNISHEDYKKQEKVIQRYFAKPEKHNPDQFTAATHVLYNSLNQLKNKHDILLESVPRQLKISANDLSVAAGSVKTQGIVGERALFQANCQRNACIFVFNMSDAPGWHAIVNGHHQPIYRINYAFMGTELGKGEATIWFVYEPFVGCFSYFLSMLTLFAVFLASRKS